MSQQLVKKGANGRMVNVNPKSWIEAIKDKNTGQTLVEILQGFNMYFLPYNGNTSSTRCLVPTMLRKKGLWITYVKYDGNVYTEWYAASEIDDKSWGDSSNWRVGNNTLVGDITISANGNWVINGTETEFKAVGEKGNTPMLRVVNNRLQVSYNLGEDYMDITDNPVYTKFRWLATSGDTQANNVGRIQASIDEGKTWTNMSNDFTNNLHIKKYIGVNESLPTSGIAEGTIYAKGPYYDEGDTLNDNPIYRLWVYAWKGNTLAWQDNGEFQSIAAGVVQETGDSETEVMSQAAVTRELSDLTSNVVMSPLFGDDKHINSIIRELYIPENLLERIDTERPVSIMISNGYYNANDDVYYIGINIYQDDNLKIGAMSIIGASSTDAEIKIQNKRQGIYNDNDVYSFIDWNRLENGATVSIQCNISSNVSNLNYNPNIRKLLKDDPQINNIVSDISIIGSKGFSYVKVYFTDGKYEKVGGTYGSSLIKIDSSTIAEYRLQLNNIAYAVAMLDSNMEVLPSLSIKASETNTAKVIAGVIDFSSAVYQDVSYIQFACWNYRSSEHYAIAGHKESIGFKIKDLSKKGEITDSTFQSIIPTTGINVNFHKQNYYISAATGDFVLDGNSKSSGLIKIAKPCFIEYKVSGGRIMYGVCFYDSNLNVLHDISISPSDTEGLKTKEGKIDLSEDIYNEVCYVAFSTYGTKEPLGKIYNETSSSIKIENLNKKIDNVDGKLYPSKEVKDYPNNYLIQPNGNIFYYQDPKYGWSTDYIPLVGVTKIICTGYLNQEVNLLSFYDSDKRYIQSLSVQGETDCATEKTIEIDITSEDYNSAFYVVASSFYKEQTFKHFVKFINENYIGKDLLAQAVYKSELSYCALGDSITDGDGNSSKSWYDMLLERYGRTETSLNFAETGQCLRTMADRCTAENMANIDICFIKGGTNQLSNYRLGTIDDVATPDRWQPNAQYNIGDRVLGGTLEKHGWTTPIYAYLYWYECIEAGISGNTVDASGFPITTNTEFTDGTVKWKCVGSPSWYSDMKGICRRVWGFNPKIQIIWIIPIKTTSDIGKPVGSWSRASKFQAIRDFCEYNSIRYIDMQKEFPLNEWTKNAIMADSLHPNKNGYNLMMNIVDSHF